MTGSRLPLDGINVLDLSRWIAGPSCAMILGDLGADVIKVEPLGGEAARSGGARVGGESAYTSTYNRNKRGLALNTRDPKSHEVLRRLCRWADVLVENYRPGTMELMGLGEAELKALNPELIHVAISGYGGLGDTPDRALFNAVAEAESGAMWLTGDQSVGPVLSGNFQADHLTGLQAAIGALAAIIGRRDAAAETSRVDVSLFHSMLAATGYAYTASLNGEVPDPTPINRDKLAAPGNVFRCADGEYVYIDAGTDALFTALVQAMGTPPEISDDMLTSEEIRNHHVDEIERTISEWTMTRESTALSDTLSQAGIPHGIVRSISEVGAEEDLRKDAAVIEVTGSAGSYRVAGNDLVFDSQRLGVRYAPPRVGEHSQEILSDVCGFEPAEIDALMAEEVTR